MQLGEGVVIGDEICGGDQLLDLRLPLTSHRRSVCVIFAFSIKNYKEVHILILTEFFVSNAVLC